MGLVCMDKRLRQGENPVALLSLGNSRLNKLCQTVGSANLVNSR